MKEELQGKLVEILTSIQSAAGKASDFAMEQLPDIAQSYVAYGRASATVWALGCLIGLVVIWFGLYRKLKDELLGGDAAGLCCILSAPPATFFFMHMNSALLVWFAPKVWLLKEIAGMLK